MADTVLDTNVLADFLAAYFINNVANHGEFHEHRNITNKFACELNIILNNYRNYGSLQDGLIIASSFAFIEVARKFELISDGRFSLNQFRAFIDTPPDWFSIAVVNNDLFKSLNELPSSIVLGNGSIEPVEWADAIHVATALERDEECRIAVTDGRVIEIEIISKRLALAK